MSDGSGDASLRDVKSSSIRQTIQLTGSDDLNSHAIYGQDVNIVPSAIDHNKKGSNKVKITPIVTYDWPVKQYHGQQVTIDRSHKYVAYTLASKTDGIVRLIHRHLAERTLIKCYKGLVVDLSFSNSTENDILASMDSLGSLYIHKIALDAANHVGSSKLLQLNWNAADIDLKRIVWCLPSDEPLSEEEEEEEESDKNMHLNVIIEKMVYVVNVDSLINEHGEGPHQYNDVSSSISEIANHKKRVVAATSAPDESAIATASEDGNAYFYSVTSMDLLYTWRPHGGKPLSSLEFLDNHLEPDSERPFWKYAVTGACNNTELKIWTCDKWRCLQTLRFNSEPDTDSFIVARLDLSSKYMALSDMSRKVLYILQIHQDDTAAHFSSISEFKLGAPILSFSIMDIRRKQLFDMSDSEDDDDEEEEDDEETINGGGERKYKKGLSVRLTAVQPKNLHDIQITFTPVTCTPGDSTVVGGSSTTDSYHPVDPLSDLSISTATAKSTDQTLTSDAGVVLQDTTSSLDELSLSLGGPRMVETPSSLESEEKSGTGTGRGSATSSDAPVPVLLTPEAFTTTPTTSAINAQLDSLMSPASAHSSLTHITHLQDNSSLAAGGSIFKAGSASTVSSMTLTPHSSMSGQNSQADPVPQQLTPTSMPLPPSTDSTPLAAEDTARQLEELFGSTIGLSGASAPPPLSDIPVLTEEDILNQPLLTSSQSTNSSLMVTAIPPPIPPSSQQLASDPVQSTLAYDTKIWPQPPPPPSGDGEESGDTDESDETGGSGHNESIDKLSSDDELNVKEIEQDVEQEDAAAAAVAAAGDVKPSSPTSQPPGSTLILHEQFTTHLEDMKASILTLNEMMMSHGRDIHNLKSSDNSQQKIDKLSKQVHAMSSSVSNKLDQTVNSMKREQKILHDKLQTTLSQTTNKVTQELRGLVEKSVNSEIKKSVLPALGQMIEPVKRDLHSVMAEKLTAADVTIKENLNRLVHSQTTIDRIGQSVGLVVQDAMQTSHRDAITQQVLPSFDSAMRSSFSQLNQAFTDGLNNYMKQLNDNMDKVRTKQMNTQSIVTASCQSAIDSLKQTSTEVSSGVASIVRDEVKKQVADALNSMKSQLIHEVQEAVRQEVASGLEGQQIALSGQLEALRSSAPTPAPGANDLTVVKAQLDQLVAMKNYEGAFKHALDAVNLSVLIYLLGKLPDSSVVFADPCPLSQPLLLSMIQQLSVGLQTTGSQLDLIFDYLSDAIINLDPQDPITGQNLAIVNELKNKLSDFLAKHPKSEYKRTVAAIEKSIKSLMRYVNA